MSYPKVSIFWLPLKMFLVLEYVRKSKLSGKLGSFSTLSHLRLQCGQYHLIRDVSGFFLPVTHKHTHVLRITRTSYTPLHSCVKRTPPPAVHLFWLSHFYLGTYDLSTQVHSWALAHWVNHITYSVNSCHWVASKSHYKRQLRHQKLLVFWGFSIMNLSEKRNSN